MTSQYEEEPRNPGVDDGKCALCEKDMDPSTLEESFCFGCGYHVCEKCCVGFPTGSHLVVAHQDEDFL